MDSLFNRYHSRQETTGRPARKVVNNPVTFVGASRGRSESDAAVRIQGAFRGYLVRKTFRKIAAVRAEVLEVERGVREEGESLELLRKEERERVKVNERLMSLLMRLDSVPGVDHGIRELRRAVIRKAIALQDAVDSIGEIKADVEDEDHLDRETAEADGCGGDDVAVEASQEESSTEQIRQATALNETVDVETKADVEDQDLQDRNHEETADSDCCGGDDVEVEAKEEDSSADHLRLATALDETVDAISETEADVEDEDRCDRNHDELAEADGCFGDDVAVEASQEDSSADQLREATALDETVEAVASTTSPDLEDNADEVSEDEEEGDGCVGDDVAAEREKEAGEAVERMREDNKRMMGMMAELLERNGEQMRLLTSLSHRVEMLERAFMWDRLRRKMNNKNCKAKKDGGDLPMDDCKKSDKR